MITLVGRVFLGLLFVLAGIGKFQAMDGFTQMVEAGGMPGVLAWPAAIFEVVAGLAIIAGFFTRYAAMALAAFCVFTATFYHQGTAEMPMFLKNLAIAGGFLMLYQLGPGPLSVDARRGGGA
jgi:putative oxidoreductase